MTTIFYSSYSHWRADDPGLGDSGERMETVAVKLTSMCNIAYMLSFLLFRYVPEGPAMSHIKWVLPMRESMHNYELNLWWRWYHILSSPTQRVTQTWVWQCIWCVLFYATSAFNIKLEKNFQVRHILLRLRYRRGWKSMLETVLVAQRSHFYRTLVHRNPMLAASY